VTRLDYQEELRRLQETVLEELDLVGAEILDRLVALHRVQVDSDVVRFESKRRLLRLLRRGTGSRGRYGDERRARETTLHVRVRL
jgi:hypothetical protein